MPRKSKAIRVKFSEQSLGGYKLLVLTEKEEEGLFLWAFSPDLKPTLLLKDSEG